MVKGYKSDGRLSGAPDKLTKELRNVLKEIVYDGLKMLNQHLNSLDSIGRIELLIKNILFVLPTINAVHYNTDEPQSAKWGPIL